MIRIAIGIAVVVLTLGIAAVVAAQSGRDYSDRWHRIELRLAQHVATGYLEVGLRYPGQQRYEYTPVNISQDTPVSGEWQFAHSSRWVAKPWTTLGRDDVCLAVQDAADAVTEQLASGDVSRDLALYQLRNATVDLGRAVEHMAVICDGVPGWNQ